MIIFCDIIQEILLNVCLKCILKTYQVHIKFYAITTDIIIISFISLFP